jgi:hypothetical protein
MTHVNSLKDDLYSHLGSIKIDNSLGVFLWMEQSIREEICFQKKHRGRDAKHDDCQYHHHDGCDCLLSPAATAKADAGKPLCLNLKNVERRTASKEPWTPEQHRRLVRERTVNTVQVARRTVSPKNIAPATELAKYADAREDITNCLRGVSASRRELYTPSKPATRVPVCGRAWALGISFFRDLFRCRPGSFVSCQSVGSTVGDFPILILPIRLLQVSR